MCFKKNCEKIGILDYRRVRWFFWIFIFSLLVVILFFIYKDIFIYIEEINGFKNIYRFFWVLPFSFIGFSFLALLVAGRGLSNDKRPWLSFVFNYFPRLIAMSLIIFSALHMFKESSGYLYYFFSAGLGLYLGYNIDRVKLEDVIPKKQ